MASGGNKSGFMEFVAVAAIVFLLWKVLSVRKIAAKTQETATTAKEVKDELGVDPDFDLNKYCQNVIYRPMSSLDLHIDPLLGVGWCYRGDRSVVDESKGFGDAYADVQAEKYTAMKAAESEVIKTNDVVQFRLINTQSIPVTTTILDTTQSTAPFTPIPAAPLADPASSIGGFVFTANWSVVPGATGYYLDVATNIGFTSFVSGYNNLDIGNVLNESISGLSSETNYYYRVRAYNDIGTSANSNIVTVKTAIADLDGNIYTSEVIGTQEWMCENLKTTKYNDGTTIPNLTADVDWAAENGTPGHNGAYCFYNNDIANKADYGLIYNWYAVNNAHGLAPAGWRVATAADYTTLLTHAGGSLIAGKKLKEAGLAHWAVGANPATNDYGFNGVGSAKRSASGFFNGFKVELYLWSSTNFDATRSRDIYIIYNDDYADPQIAVFGDGMAVRCVRDV